MPSEPIVVAFIASEFQVRGSSAYTQRLARRLPPHGFRPVIVSPDSDCVPEPCRSELELFDYGLLETPLLSGIVARLAARDLRKFNPRLVHIQSRQAVSYGQTIARSLHLPYLLTVQDYQEEQEAIELDPHLNAGVIAVSEFVRDGLRKASSDWRYSIDIIQSGVDIPHSDDGAHVLDEHRTPVIGTAGPLEASKGLDFFLHAAKAVLSQGHAVEFLIAGSGPEETKLRELTRQLEIVPNVTFVTNLLDFGASLRAMDIFCLPSLTQGLGTIMLEAMALGRPVIASEVGGVAKFVRDDQTGLAVPPSDSTRLAERMIELLCNPARAREIGAKARALVVDRFNADRMVEDTVRLYQRVLSSPLAR